MLVATMGSPRMSISIPSRGPASKTQDNPLTPSPMFSIYSTQTLDLSEAHFLLGSPETQVPVCQRQVHHIYILPTHLCFREESWGLKGGVKQLSSLTFDVTFIFTGHFWQDKEKWSNPMVTIVKYIVNLTMVLLQLPEVFISLPTNIVTMVKFNKILSNTLMSKRWLANDSLPFIF